MKIVFRDSGLCKEAHGKKTFREVTVIGNYHKNNLVPQVIKKNGFRSFRGSLVTFLLQISDDKFDTLGLFNRKTAENVFSNVVDRSIALTDNLLGHKGTTSSHHMKNFFLLNSILT